jgi:D-lactate dehydrogenase
MCCGVAQNAYHTLESLTFVLPSGTTVDTAHRDADEVFRAREPALACGLLTLKDAIERNGALSDRIRSKYRMKNTTGYSLNARRFLAACRHHAHLLIGSEGTLGFIAEAGLRTVSTGRSSTRGCSSFPPSARRAPPSCRCARRAPTRWR